MSKKIKALTEQQYNSVLQVVRRGDEFEGKIWEGKMCLSEFLETSESLISEFQDIGFEDNIRFWMHDVTYILGSRTSVFKSLTLEGLGRAIVDAQMAEAVSLFTAWAREGLLIGTEYCSITFKDEVQMLPDDHFDN